MTNRELRHFYPVITVVIIGLVVAALLAVLTLQHAGANQPTVRLTTTNETDDSQQDVYSEPGATNPTKTVASPMPPPKARPLNNY